jgi:chemotaxis protein methyltransferase CheR
VRAILRKRNPGLIAQPGDGFASRTSLREVPPQLIELAFDRMGARYCIKSKHREGVTIVEQDLRSEAPSDLFDLILCRYVAFYFSVPLQCKILNDMLQRLRPQGYLVIGTHEQLPRDVPELAALDRAPQIFQKPAKPEELRPAAG